MGGFQYIVVYFFVIFFTKYVVPTYPSGGDSHRSLSADCRTEITKEKNEQQCQKVLNCGFAFSRLTDEQGFAFLTASGGWWIICLWYNQNTQKENMSEIFSRSFSQRNTKLASFIFFGLLVSSAALFVFAGDSISTKNIFQDSDQDGLSNDEEKLYGTNPSVKDSDGDGYGDGVEVESGYNPLKPAPGDKIVKEISNNNSSSDQFSATQNAPENLTEKVSEEIANIIKNSGQGGDKVSMEDVDEAVQKVLGEANDEEAVLPEVNIEDIKIKKGPSKSLSEEKRKKQERDDALEYLTVMAYIMANNSPREFKTEDDLSNMLTNLAKDSITELTSGNIGLLNQLSKHGEKIMEELKDIEVPEKMLDTHIKALKMAKYSIQLKEELNATQNDPMGQIAVLAKAQGFLGSATELVDEINKKLVDLDIKGVPLNL